MSAQIPEHLNGPGGDTPHTPPVFITSRAASDIPVEPVLDAGWPRIIPVRARRDEQSQLALRLEAVLRGGAQSIGCQAAALYLLDDATTELKLRACWGMSRQKLAAQARPLRGALADLEALLGHAVAIEDTALLPQWPVPEPCGAALCVPVASPTDPLGTLWMFDDRPRGFDDHQTQLAEIIAGRIAAELQRDRLLGERSRVVACNEQWLAASNWQLVRQPTIQPLEEPWQFAGLTTGGRGLQGSFFDWLVLPDGNIMLLAASCSGEPFRAALLAAELRGIFYGASLSNAGATDGLEPMGEAFRQASASGDEASLAHARLQPDTREIICAVRGQAAALHVGRNRTRWIGGDAAPLGATSDAAREPERIILRSGETLFMVTDDPAADCDGVRRERLAATALQLARRAPDELLEAIRAQLEPKGEHQTSAVLLLRG